MSKNLCHMICPDEIWTDKHYVNVVVIGTPCANMTSPMSLSLGTAPEVNSKACRATPRDLFEKETDRASMPILPNTTACYIQRAANPASGLWMRRLRSWCGLGVKASTTAESADSSSGVVCPLSAGDALQHVQSKWEEA